MRNVSTCRQRLLLGLGHCLIYRLILGREFLPLATEELHHFLGLDAGEFLEHLGALRHREKNVRGLGLGGALS